MGPFENSPYPASTPSFLSVPNNYQTEDIYVPRSYQCDPVHGVREAKDLASNHDSKSDALSSGEIDDSKEINLVKLNPGKLMIVPISVSSRVLHGLIDTGSSISLIRESAVPPNTPYITCIESVCGLGTKATSHARVNLPLALGSVTLDCTLLVMSDREMERDLLLGTDFLSKHGLTLDLSKLCLSGGACGGQFEVYFFEEDPMTVFRKLPVYACNSVMLCKDEPVTVPVAVQGLTSAHEDSQEYCFEVYQTRSHPFITGYDGILQLNNGKSSVMLQINSSAKNRTHSLKSGTLLGYLSTVVTVEPSAEVNLIQGQSEKPWTEEEVSKHIELDHLSPTEAWEVHQMIASRSSVLSRGETDIGCAGVTRHKIVLHDDTPIRQKPRRFPEPVVEEVERQCEELKRLDVIDYSKSPWSSPIVPIRKKDGSVRLCIDYRKLNKVTKADHFPLPNMTEMVYSIHGTKYFTTLDLVKGYYQVPLHPDSQECTAFSTSRNHYEFKRLSFGLKNAPAAFQREMQAILHGFNSKQVLVYIDDILIMSRTFQEHLELVGAVLHTLDQYGIKIKPSKCCWFKQEVEFLGHVVGSTGVRKSEQYMQVVKEFPRPTTVKELRSFLGLVNFQRKFIPQCSVLAKPLTCLMSLNDKTRLSYTDEMEQAFHRLKDAICSDIELAYPDYGPDSCRMELSTDASGYGAGACLTQVQDGQVRVISYASTTFNKAQQNYSTIDRELAAIRWALGYFRSFLFGVPFILYTDHRPLVYMQNMSQRNSRIARTMSELSEYDFEVRYRAGKDNRVADLLSRLTPIEEEPNDLVTRQLPEGLSLLATVEGGGDAMIKSLHAVLVQHRGCNDPTLVVPNTEADLRQLIVDEMTTNPTGYGFPSDRTSRRKLKLLSLPGQLLDECALEAFAKLYSLDVWVHHGLAAPIIHTAGDAPAQDPHKRVHLQCKAGVHFNPLMENRLYQPPKEIPTSDSASVAAQSDIIDDTVAVDVEVLVTKIPSLHCTCSGNNSVANILVQLDNKNFCALLDTGAQINLISDRVLHELSKMDTIDKEGSYVTLKSLGETRLETLGVSELPVKLHGVDLEVTVPFAVVSDSIIPHCMILGANIIKLLSCEFDFRAQRISVFVDDSQIILPRLSPIQGVASNNLCLLQQDVQISNQKLAKSLLNREQVVMVQKADHAISQLKRKVLNKLPPSRWNSRCLHRFKNHASRLHVEDDILWHDSNDGLKVVLPFRFLVEISLQVHWQNGHLGRNKLINALQAFAWHPSCTQVAADICTSCDKCQRYKVSSQQVSTPILKIEELEPFALLAVDLLQLPTTTKGHVGCLVSVDHGSKWLSVVPIRNKKASTVAHALEHNVLPALPVRPLRLLSDNGCEFTAPVFQEVLDRYGIKHTTSSPYHPSSNGAVERANRTVSELLRCLSTENPQSWDEQLPRAVIIYNQTWHSQIQMSPSEFLMEKSHVTANNPQVSNQTNLKWKMGNPDFAPFRVGDLVLRKLHLQGHSTVNKFKPRYEGPYKVKVVHSNGVSYLVSTLEESPKLLKVHHTHLKLWKEPPSYLKMHPFFQDLDRQLGREDSVSSSETDIDQLPMKMFVDFSSSSDNCDFSGFEQSEHEIFFPSRHATEEFESSKLDSELEHAIQQRSIFEAFPNDSAGLINVQSTGCFVDEPEVPQSVVVDTSESSVTEQDSTVVDSQIIDLNQGSLSLPTHVSLVPDIVSNRHSTPKKSLPFSYQESLHSLSPIPVPCLPAITFSLECDLLYQESLLDSALEIIESQLEVFSLECIHTISSSPTEPEPLIHSDSSLGLPALFTQVQRSEVFTRSRLSGNRGSFHVEVLANPADPPIDFSGFQETMPNSRILRLENIRKQINLDSVWKSLSEAQSLMSEYRRRSRARLQSLSPGNLNELPVTEPAKDLLPGTPVVVPDEPQCRHQPHTRSQGPCQEHPNVQHGILEYRK